MWIDLFLPLVYFVLLMCISLFRIVNVYELNFVLQMCISLFVIRLRFRLNVLLTCVENPDLQH